MKKKKNSKLFVFETNISLDEWIGNLSCGFERYVQENHHDMRFRMMEKNRFRIGLERAGHSSGYWYCAHVEKVAGKTRIFGQIVLDPDENDQPQPAEKMPFKDWLWAAPLVLIIVILGAIPYAIWQLVRWIRRVPGPMKKEEILVEFMTNAMNCCYLNEEIADV